MKDEDADVLRVSIASSESGERLDKALVKLCPGFSRSRLQALIEAGELYLNGAPCLEASRKVRAGDEILLALPDLEEAIPEPQDIPLNIVYEDSHLIVLDKEAGMVVHPAAGNPDGTLVNALLHHCAGSLSGINGVRRPGIVHRLDKDTSGLMIVAKNDQAHQALSAQLQDRSLSRMYLALVLGVPSPPKGRVETLIGRHPSNRLKMAVVNRNGKDAITHYQNRQTFHDTLALVECRLATGRTHQIRVHMEYLGHPLIGDPLYRAQATALKARLRKGGYEGEAARIIETFPRQALHAAEIKFFHPESGELLSFSSPLPKDFSALLQACL
jgi:23S rRNA pseudouridine1911/1915/1917 synthase